MSTKIVPNQWRLDSAVRFVDSITGGLYAWLGDHSDTADVPQLTDSVSDSVIEPYRSMICGKSISFNDVRLIIRRIPYESGKVYVPYDDQDPALSIKDFYAIVTSGSNYHVFKCLNNAGGIPSTVAPDIADVSDSDQAYFTADGYQWKYMCLSTLVDVSRFGTADFFPIRLNDHVSEVAVPGAVDVIKIVDPGQGYDNYLTGSFGSTDLRVNGNTLVYSLSSNTTASGSNGFYSNCLMTITSGTGSGQYEEVSQYVSNSSGRFVVLSEEYGVPPTNGSEWEVTPIVRIKGSGRQTVNAAARAIIDPAGNTVSQVEILDRGSGYDFISASVEANTVVGVDVPAVVRGIYSPPGGHGANAFSELWASRAVVSAVFVGDEDGTIPAVGSFKKIGLMEGPVFSNVVVDMSQSNGQFLDGETAYSIQTVRIPGVFSTTQGDDTVTVDANTDLTLSVSIKDWLFLESGPDHQLAQVQSFVNSSAIQLYSNAYWTSTVADGSLATINRTMLVANTVDANTVRLATLSGPLLSGEVITGVDSGAWGIVSTVSRSGQAKGVETFIQLVKILGSDVSGTFVPNESVYQGASLATADVTATLHSVSNGVMYVSNTLGGVITGAPIFGVDSGAIFQVTDKYDSEVVFGSGQITYVENIASVDRAVDQSETINFLLEF